MSVLAAEGAGLNTMIEGGQDKKQTARLQKMQGMAMKESSSEIALKGSFGRVRDISRAMSLGFEAEVREESLLICSWAHYYYCVFSFKSGTFRPSCKEVSKVVMSRLCCLFFPGTPTQCLIRRGLQYAVFKAHTVRRFISTSQRYLAAGVHSWRPSFTRSVWPKLGRAGLLEAYAHVCVRNTVDV